METLEDKQKELDALQAEFDEYIVSSREMEEELEGEMNKCRECPIAHWSFVCFHTHIYHWMNAFMNRY